MNAFGLVGSALVLWAVWACFKMSALGRFAAGGNSAVALQNGDKIACNIALEIRANDSQLLAAAIPFSSDRRESIKAEIALMTEAIINRWAFQFPSAIEARQKSSFESLTDALIEGIISPTFSVLKVNVIGIEILSKEPPPPPTPPAEPSDAENALSALEGKKSTFQAVDGWIKDNPELAVDPEFEPVITPIRKRFLDANGMSWQARKRRNYSQ